MNCEHDVFAMVRGSSVHRKTNCSKHTVYQFDQNSINHVNIFYLCDHMFILILLVSWFTASGSSICQSAVMDGVIGSSGMDVFR